LTQPIRLFRWRRWWNDVGLPALRIMAIEHWDPLDVYDDASRADAYDAYLDRVGRMLRRGKSAEEIARYLGAVRTKALGRGESETADELFAERVTAWYALEAPRA
jgi:hypothetical protein